jgi:uroporphyrinogen decarboxylase
LSSRGRGNTRCVLPYLSPDEVCEHVLRNLDPLAIRGGFVFQQVHNIQTNVPPENIVAMWEAWQKYGVY